MAKQNEEVENIGARLQATISESVRLALAARGKRQADLARAFGISRTTMSQKISGKCGWTIEDMEKAGRYLGIEPAWFLRSHDIGLSSQVVGPQGLEPWTGGLLPLEMVKGRRQVRRPFALFGAGRR